MRTNQVVAPFAGACLAVLALGQAAHANILINVDKSTQRMSVVVDGRPLYNWAVSTGAPGYDTPSGSFRPFRMSIHHVSHEYNSAPMPYSIFFTMTGDAVHGTNEVTGLGHPVSHGCVRLSVQHAAILWGLVTQEKMGATLVDIGGTIPYGAATTIARLAPVPPTSIPSSPNDGRYRYNQGYGNNQSYADNQSYGNYRRRPPLFPFFSLFGGGDRAPPP